MTNIRQGMLDPAAALRVRTDDAERKMRRTIDTFRSTGRTLAADNLGHFLDGKGADRLLDDAEVERHQPILNAERDNRARLHGSLLGVTRSPSLRAGLDKLRSDKVPDGQWIDLGRDNWDRDYTTGDNIRNWLFDDDNMLNRARKWFSGDDDQGNDDFAVGLGATKLGVGARFQGRKLGHELEFRGTAVHASVRNTGKGVQETGERYDFNEGQPGAREAGQLRDAGHAQAYVNWARGERMTAKQRKDPNGDWVYSEEPRWQRLSRDDVGDQNIFFRD